MRRLLLAALLLAGCAPGRAQDWYVDYAGGSDAAAGTSPAVAWKHSPGDPEAAARAAAVRLRPGDTVHFKGGVAYRGTVAAQADGEAERPIRFTGSGFGDGRAVIDGADPVISTTPCPSAAACGGALGWRDLSLVAFAAPPTSFIKLYDAQGPLTEAQLPAPADPFYADDVAEYAESPLSEKNAIEAGRLHAPQLVRQLGGQARGVLSIWIAGNQVVRRAVTGIDGDTLLFAPEGLKLYDNRPGRYALLGLASAVTAPGQYAVIAPGQAVVRLRPGGGALLIGNGRGGFDLGGRSHIAVTGFTFAHQTGAAQQQREGIAISRTGAAGTDIAITGNHFENSAMWNGQGVLTVRGVDGATISGNVIDTIERGSGLRAANASNIKVSGNIIRRVGRTGIAFLGVADSVIADNVIEGLRGIHGNGISLYLNNRRIAVTGNRVTATTRPMTFHGDKNTTAPGDHDFTITGNIFIATPVSQAALTSWGAATRGVTITGNVLAAGKAGLLLNGSDERVTATGNASSGIVYNHGEGPGWRVGGNRTINATLPADDSKGFCAAAAIPAGTAIAGIKC